MPKLHKRNLRPSPWDGFSRSCFFAWDLRRTEARPQHLLTQAANHLLPLAHPPNDLRHAINSRRDARSSINASRERRHENEIRRREEYDRDHGIPAQS
jgi:hypothetical protein